MIEDENLFENLPFEEAVEIYTNYMIAKRDKNLKTMNKLFTQHPDMFQPETLQLAKETIIHITKRNNNVALFMLVEELEDS